VGYVGCPGDWFYCVWVLLVVNPKAKALSDMYEAAYEAATKRGVPKNMALRVSRATIARRIGKKK
jgi:hypothetical protein